MGITFEVDDVLPATRPRDEEPASTMLARKLGGFVIRAWRANAENVLVGPDDHPLLAAVHAAFSEHRPLVLSPDAVWLTILQGFAIHVNVHAESLRRRFVGHEGKVTLDVIRSASVEDGGWAQVISDFGVAVREHVGKGTYNACIANFSTSGPIERTASEVAMLDAFQRYFDYELMCICGIPQVTLLGTPGDWRQIVARTRVLGEYDLGWWTSQALPVLEKFVETAEGKVDRDFWQCIYKPKEAYGGETITGWLVRLFPYGLGSDGIPFRVEAEGKASKRARWISPWGLRASSYPLGLASAPVRVVNAVEGSTRLVRMIGGLVGVGQHPRTRAVTPLCGWSVAERPFDQVLARVAEHGTAPIVRSLRHWSFPAQLLELYGAIGSATIGSARLRPLEEIKEVKGEGYRRPLLQFCDLADGTGLAVAEELDWMVVHVDPAVKVKLGVSLPVVARTVSDALTALLDSNGAPRFDVIRQFSVGNG